MDYSGKAEEMHQAVQAHFFLPGVRLYRQNSPSQARERRFADLWSYSSALSALVALLGVSEVDFEPAARLCLDGLAAYWRGPGYSSYVVADGGGDRYYDDNAWVGIELLGAYRHLGEQIWLEQAREAFDFVVSGWSEDMGGGLYWRERDTSSKNTASNGPAIVHALQLSDATGEQRYLDWALKIYAWLNARLRSPHGIYWDSLQRSGEIDRTTWTYNTGIMIQANILLYRVNGSACYLDEARRIARFSLEHFAQQQPDDAPVFPATPWFNAVLYRGYSALSAATGDSTYADALLCALDRGWQRARDANGLLAKDWSGRTDKNSGFWALLDEASVIEIYALAAQRERTAPPASTILRQETVPGTESGPVVTPVALHTDVEVLSPMGTVGSCWRLGDTLICNTVRTGPLHVRAPIRPYYEQTDGPPGPLGFPVTAVSDALRSPFGTAGVFQRFEGSRDYPPQVVRLAGGLRYGATVYWSEAFGPRITWFEIGELYESLGGTGSRLGFPTSERAQTGPSVRGTRGYCQRMEGGAIYTSEHWSTFPVWGAIAVVHDHFGGAIGRLGYPVTRELPATPTARGTSGTFQRFEGPEEYPQGLLSTLGDHGWGATVYWSERSGAYTVLGEIGACYERSRGTAGPFGFPVANAGPDPANRNGCRQEFENGWIAWTPDRGITMWRRR